MPYIDDVKPLWRVKDFVMTVQKARQGVGEGKKITKICVTSFVDVPFGETDA